MEWAFIAAIAVVALAYIFLRRPGQISVREAHKCLSNGALVVDVRTPAEFNMRHLPAAINLPVDQIETTLPPRVTDKNQSILLHCRAGRRSALAMEKLNAIGYTNVYNLGSYTRAERIVGST